MQHKAKSIRPFIGAKVFEVSRQFNRDLGFEECIASHNMSFCKTDGVGFYLQDAYVKDWIDNTMVFLEVDDVERHWKELKALDLPAKYENVRLTPIRTEHWGREYFCMIPLEYSGNLVNSFGELSTAGNYANTTIDLCPGCRSKQPLLGEIRQIQIEPHVGGRFLFSDFRNGSEARHWGNYLELERPHLIVFTWIVDESQESDPSKVTLTIASDGDGCIATIIHEMDAAWIEYLSKTEQGWTRMLKAVEATKQTFHTQQ